MAVMDIVIRAVDQASKVIDHIGSAGERMGKQLNTVTDRLDGVSKSCVSAGKTLTLGITTPVMGLLGGLVKTGVQFKAFKQESQQAFGVLLGSSELAIQHMDKILAFARTTPFAFPDLVTANRKLVAFGMTAEETFPVMEAIANSVAAMGGGAQEIDEIADVFARITSTGKITSMELNRLGSKGINALTIMANKAGVSIDDMRDKISKGSIDSRTAIEWLVDGMMNGTEGVAGATVAMGGSLGALKNTFGGAIDSMKGAWRTAADTIVSEDIFAKVIEAVHRLTDVIRGLPDLLGPLAEGVGGMLIGLVDKIAAAVDWFFNLDPAIQQSAVQFGALMVALGPALLIFGKLTGAISGIIKGAGTMVSVIGTAVNIFTYAGRAIRLFSAAVQSGVLAQQLAAVATKVWTGVQAVFNAVMSANPIALVIIGIAALIAAIILCVKYWDQITAAVTNAWHKFKEWFDNLPGWAKVLLAIVAPITLVIANIDKIADAAKRAWEATAEFFGWGRKTIVDEVTELGGEAVGEVVKMSSDIENSLFQLQLSGGKITEDFANEVIENSKRMKEMAVQEIEEQHKETVLQLEYLRDESGIITAAQYERMMEIENRRKDEAIQNQEELSEAVIAKIKELQESGVEVTAEMRAAIESEIFAQRDAVIMAVAEQGSEVGVILSKLRHSSGNITKEMASEAIKNSLEQRDKTVANAEEQYENTIRAINAMSDEAIAATGNTRDELIEIARDQRDVTVQTAEDMHKETVDEIYSMCEGMEGEIDESTGRILTGWDKFKIGFVDGVTGTVNAVDDWFSRLPGILWGHLVNAYNRAVKWSDDLKETAKNAGRDALNGFIDYIKSLPSKLWDILIEAGRKLLEIGGVLWQNAKDAASQLWEGFKKGIGKSSPSYLERAIDDIAERASELPGEVNTNFQKLKSVKLPNVFGNEKIQVEGVADASQSKQTIAALRERGIAGESRGIERNLSPITIHLHIGTFIGDKAGLKKLERMLQEIRIEENSRMDFAFSGGVKE